ncbi:MAG: efflux RND transporter permease subunit [Alphaproteobacteria bacterium]|nr:efflux RND transporter permease subunit [Alphaproteobacteria bacterium]
MNISAPFIFRPIGTSLLGLAIICIGIVAYLFLPVSALPKVDFPTISISASLPGASPEIMATSIASPLERQLGRIAGITEMTSSNALGSTRITVQFDLERDINGAARDVQGAINASLSQLPADLPNNPTYRIVNPADAPICILALTSDVYSKIEMYDTASTFLAQKLSQEEGVGQVIVGGSSLPAVRVEINPMALNNYNLSLEDVKNVIQSSNVTMPKGQIEDETHTYELKTNDQIFKAYQYKPIIISYKNGAAIKLSDVADVTDSFENLRNAGFYNNKESVLLIVFKLPGSNIIETVNNIYKIMPHLKASIPQAIDMTMTLDRTTTIRASLKDVEFTLILSIALVILVIYIFLRDVRASLIPSIVIPISLLGTFGLMYLAGYSLNNLSLMALTISTGFVVDDAVVVLENIARHIEKGMHPFKAALIGAQEVGFTVLSMSISLIAVFIPILLMGGIVGRLFHEFAMSLSFAILVSMVVSLTITPMMASQMLKAKKNSPNNKIKKKKISFTKSMIKFYGKSLKSSLRHPAFVLIILFLIISLNIYLFIIVPKGFFPIQDTGRIMGSIRAQQDISFPHLKQKLQDYVHLVKEDPAVERVSGFVGGNTALSNAGTMFIVLKPPEIRKVTIDDVMKRLRKKLSDIPGSTLFMRIPQELQIGGRQGSGNYQYTLSSYELDELNHWTPLVMEEIKKIEGIVDLNNDQLDQGLEYYVTIDRDRAAQFGISEKTIDTMLYNLFGQRQISTMYTSLNQYNVVLVVALKFWQDPDTLNQIYLTSSDGKQVPLSAFASFKPSQTLLAVNHQEQFPSATLSFNLLPDYSIGEAVEKIKKTVADMNLPLATIKGTFRGTAQAFEDSLKSQPYLILAALFAVYIVLGVLYESFVHPVTILSTLPSAGVGAILALLLMKTELSIIAIIGIILLIGIVKKNAIMMIDFAVQIERKGHKTPQQSIYEASLLRFRPIMMTTMAAILGALPLAFGDGVGSELRKPLGISIIGGLILSQILTLYTTPVIYLSFEALRIKMDKLFTRKKPLQPIEEI